MSSGREDPGGGQRGRAGAGSRGPAGRPGRWTRAWLRLVSTLVPRSRRDDWLREWTSELGAAEDDVSTKHSRRMALGALPDAIAVRRHGRPDPAGGSSAAGGWSERGFPGQGAGPGSGRARGRITALAGIGTELRRAARSLARAPGFAVASIVTLGVGLGATAAIFTLLDGIVLRPLPYPSPDRLVRVGHLMDSDETSAMPLARWTYGMFGEQNRSFDAFEGYWAPGSYTLAGTEAAAERVTGVRATVGLLGLLGARVVAGRLFTEADAEQESASGVILSERLWRRRYGGDPGMVGRTVLIDGAERPVVGVVAGTGGTSGVDLPGRAVDLWLPWVVPASARPDDAFRIHVIARLAEGATVGSAQSDMARLDATLPEHASFYRIYLDQGLRTTVTPLRDEVLGEVAGSLWILLGAVVLVLLVAGANVAMLFLVRAEARRSEVAVRRALGAAGPRLFGTFLAETTLVVLAAGGLALGLAWAGVRVVVATSPPGLPRLEELAVRPPTLALVLTLSAAAAALLAAYPIIRFHRAETGGRRGGAGEDRGAATAGSALVVVQVALALVLLCGASLLLQTFRHLRAVDPGFEPGGVLVTELSLPAPAYPTRDEVHAFQRRLLERVEALPGVRRAALGPSPLTTGGCSGLYAEGMVLAENEFPPCIPEIAVSAGYFEVLGIPVVAGRAFEAADLERPPVAMVTANAADRLWPGGDPLAGAVHPSPRRGPPWYPVVGVVGAVRSRGPDQPAGEAVYLPIASSSTTEEEPRFQRATTLLVATTPGAETSLVPALRRLVSELDANVPLTVRGTLEEQLAASMVRRTFMLFLLGTAAATALVLGLVGLYGVVAYRVERRRGEIGVRMAMGARAPQVRAMVLGHSLRLVAIGTLAGLLAAAFLTRTLSALLFGVRPGDPVLLGLSAAALVLAATAASLIPAHRATRIDPARALRSD